MPTVEQMTQILALEQQLANMIQDLLKQMNASPPPQAPPAPLAPPAPPIVAPVVPVVNVSLPVQQVGPGMPPEVIAPHVANPVLPTPLAIPTVDGPQMGSNDDGSPRFAQIDRVVPAGTPGTWTSTVTGHTLSLPKSGVDVNGNWNGVGEGMIGYYLRTALQVGSTIQDAINTQGCIFLGMEPAARPPNRGVAAWPQQSDEMRNLNAYTPVDPAAAAAAAAQWAAANARMAQSAAPAAPSVVEPLVVEG